MSKTDKIFATTSILLSVMINYIMGKNIPSLNDKSFKLYMIIWASMILGGSILQWYVGFKITMKEFKKR